MSNEYRHGATNDARKTPPPHANGTLAPSLSCSVQHALEPFSVAVGQATRRTIFWESPHGNSRCRGCIFQQPHNLPGLSRGCRKRLPAASGEALPTPNSRPPRAPPTRALPPKQDALPRCSLPGDPPDRLAKLLLLSIRKVAHTDGSRSLAESPPDPLRRPPLLPRAIPASEVHSQRKNKTLKSRQARRGNQLPRSPAKRLVTRAHRHGQKFHMMYQCVINRIHLNIFYDYVVVSEQVPT